MKPNLHDRGAEILEDCRARTMLKSFGYDQVDAVESSVRAVHGSHANSSSQYPLSSYMNACASFAMLPNPPIPAASVLMPLDSSFPYPSLP